MIFENTRTNEINTLTGAELLIRIKINWPYSFHYSFIYTHVLRISIIGFYLLVFYIQKRKPKTNNNFEMIFKETPLRFTLLI